MNDTLRKFGYPDTVIHESDHWAILLRHAQTTLGAAVLAAKHPARSLGDLPADVWADMGPMAAKLEAGLARLFAHDKINYLALMMVDREVHFHVLPRYAEGRMFAGVPFGDPGWPRVPDLGHETDIDATVRQELLQTLRREIAAS